MVDVDALIKKAREQLESVAPVTAAEHVQLGPDIVDVEFVPMRGHEWREFTALKVPRPGAVTDALGFNVDEATRDYPRFRIVQDGEVDTLHRGEGKDTRYVWADVYDVLDPAAIDTITTSLLSYHLFDPMVAMRSAGKASKGRRRKSPASPASSE